MRFQLHLFALVTTVAMIVADALNLDFNPPHLPAASETLFSMPDILEGKIQLAKILQESSELKEAVERRRMQDLPVCYNFGELPFLTPLLGQTVCGHMTSAMVSREHLEFTALC